jgi:hypothetical protein
MSCTDHAGLAGNATAVSTSATELGAPWSISLIDYGYILPGAAHESGCSTS